VTPEEFAASFLRIADNFDVLVHTPESVGKLRKAVLELAVRGQLVAQDPNDEPAGKLLALLRDP
jgi:type I restriction enzyme S subunit